MKKFFNLMLIVFVLLFACNVNAAVSEFDHRDRDVAPIAVEEVDIIIDFSAHTTVAETEITINGQVLMYSVEVPALEGAATTVTVDMKNDDNVDIETQTAIAEGVTTLVRPSAVTYLTQTSAIEVTASAAQIADKTITVLIWYK